MRNLIIPLVMLCIFLLPSSCKKNDLNEKLNQQQMIEARLFNLSEVLDQDIIEVANKIKSEGKRKNFLEYFFQFNGIPLWSKALKKEDSEKYMAIIPFVKDQSTNVKGFIVAIKHKKDDFVFSVFSKDYLKMYGFYMSSTLNSSDVNVLLDYFDYSIFNRSTKKLGYAMLLPLDIRKSNYHKTSPDFLNGRVKRVLINGNTELRTTTAFCFSITEEVDWWWDPDGDDDPCDCSGNEYYVYTSTEVMNICIELWGGGSGLVDQNGWWIADPVLGNGGGGGGGGGYNLTTEQKLNLLLRPGDSYYFINTDPNQPQEPWEEEPVNYSTVEEFENATKNYKFESSISFDQGTEKVLNFRINRTLVGGYDFKIKIKQNSSNIYEVVAVTSDEWGFTPGWSWSQSQYAANVSGDTIIVDVYGKEKYNIIVEGIGTVFSAEQHYRMKINKNTGAYISVEKI